MLSIELNPGVVRNHVSIYSITCMLSIGLPPRDVHPNVSSIICMLSQARALPRIHYRAVDVRDRCVFRHYSSCQIISELTPDIRNGGKYSYK